MKILLLGASGQLGTELNRQLLLIAEIKAYTRSELDITDTQAVIETISSFKPNVIVNAAAYTAVDKAEEDKVNADKINHLAVKSLAKFPSLPLVIIYSINITLPSVNCFPIVPSPNVISYFL